MNEDLFSKENFAELDKTNRAMIISYVKRIIFKNFLSEVKRIKQLAQYSSELYTAISLNILPNNERLKPAYDAAKILFKAKNLDELPAFCQQIGISYLDATEEQNAKKAAIEGMGDPLREIFNSGLE